MRMLPSFCKDEITVIRAPLVDSPRGGDMRDWDNATEHNVARCSVQAGETASDFTAPRTENGLVRYNVFAQPNADVQAGDRVRYNGIVYELNGAPQVWNSPTGRISHMTFSLVEWSG